MAAHSSTLAWKIPWAEEPGRLQSMASLRVRHDWATSLSLFTFMHWRRKMATHSTVLAWRIPGTGEPGGLPSRGSHRWASQMVQWQKYKPANVGHVDLIPGFERSSLVGNGNPLQWKKPSCLENPMDGGAWYAAVHGVAKSWIRLSDFTFTFHLHALEKENGNPLQCSCLKNLRDGGAWWAAVYGVAQSWTWLKWLSSSSRWVPRVRSFFVTSTACVHILEVKTRLPWWLSDKESTFDAGAIGDPGSIPGSGRSPRGRHGNPLHYSYLENLMDGEA